MAWLNLQEEIQELFSELSDRPHEVEQALNQRLTEKRELELAQGRARARAWYYLHRPIKRGRFYTKEEAAAQVQNWRNRNRAKYNAYMREYRRTKNKKTKLSPL